jgi:hypothetical protein
MEIFGGGGRVKTLENHLRANNVSVFGNTEKPSRIRDPELPPYTVT